MHTRRSPPKSSDKRAWPAGYAKAKGRLVTAFSPLRRPAARAGRAHPASPVPSPWCGRERAVASVRESPSPRASGVGIAAWASRLACPAMAAASIRACFVTLRPQHGGELPAELRFAPELQLLVGEGEEARGGCVGEAGALLLRRERSGVYCTAATGELRLQAEGGACAELPFRLLLDKEVLSVGEVLWSATEAPRLALRSAGAPAPAADEEAVELELVVLVTSESGQPTAVSASLKLAQPVTAPVPPSPGAFLRSASGRAPALEPIDEDRGVRSPHAAPARRTARRLPALPPQSLTAPTLTISLAAGCAAAAAALPGRPAVPGRAASGRRLGAARRVGRAGAAVLQRRRGERRGAAGRPGRGAHLVQRGPARGHGRGPGGVPGRGAGRGHLDKLV